MSCPGNGEFIVGMSNENKKLHNIGDEFIGTISHFNIWDKFMNMQDLRRMQHGCGGRFHEAIKPWAEVLNHTVGLQDIRRPSTCKDEDGKLQYRRKRSYLFDKFWNCISVPKVSTALRDKLKFVTA